MNEKKKENKTPCCSYEELLEELLDQKTCVKGAVSFVTLLYSSHTVNIYLVLTLPYLLYFTATLVRLSLPTLRNLVPYYQN